MGSNAPNFENCSGAVSKVTRPFGSFKTTWTLEGFQDQKTFRTLIDTAKTHLKIGNGLQQCTLEFTIANANIQKECNVVLQMAIQEKYSETCTVFDVEVYTIGKETTLLSKEIQLRINEVDKVCTVSKLFRTSQYVEKMYESSKWVEDTEFPDSLTLGIVVTPVQINGQVTAGKQDQHGKIANPTGIIEDLKRFYGEVTDNYADLKLESKDGMMLSVHKFIIAARSQILHNMIEDAMKLNGFDGTIKLLNVDGKPLMIVLHWMYSGELREDAEKHIEELVTAAINYELWELLDLLDGELIKICTPENMLTLFQVAKQNNMKLAKKQLSAFIKENLEH